MKRTVYFWIIALAAWGLCAMEDEGELPESPRVAQSAQPIAIDTRIFNLKATPERPNGHEKKIRSVSFSPTGEFFLTSSDDNTAKIWDASTANCILTLKGHKNGVRTAQYNHRGTLVVTASHDFTARIWDTISGRQLQCLKGHQGPVNSAFFSPKGLFVLTASDDNTAKLWNVITGECTYTLDNHKDWVRFATFSPDGTRILTASNDRTVKLWTTETGQYNETFDFESSVNAAFMSPDNNRILVSQSNGVSAVWNSGNIVPLFNWGGQEGWVHQSIYSADGQDIVSLGVGQSVDFRTPEAKLFVSFPLPYKQIQGVSLSQDEKRILTWGDDFMVRITQ